jgi:hypothetical protein
MKNFFLFFLLLASTISWSQIKTPAPSPAAKITQTVGLTEVTIEYSRPGMKGRTIFGDLVPYNTNWRTGANASTKITFSDDVEINGKPLKAGTYALFSTPSQQDWQLVFYKNTGISSPPKEWVESDVALSVSATPTKLSQNVETFTFDINDITNDQAVIALSWEKTRVPFTVKVPTEAKVMKNIEAVMNGPSASDYYATGRYYYDSGKDKVMALEYIQVANQKDPKFWTLRLESLVLADLGRKQDAINTAKRSLEMARTAGNDDYVRMNESSIAEWSK